MQSELIEQAVERPHFEVLDGLRGSAAFLIVIFHLFNYDIWLQLPFESVTPRIPGSRFLLRRLSGFVVAYAYDDRWTRMSIPPILPHSAHPAPSSGTFGRDFWASGLSLRSLRQGYQPHSSPAIAAGLCDLIAAIAFTSSRGKARGNSGAQWASLVTQCRSISETSRTL